MKEMNKDLDDFLLFRTSVEREAIKYFLECNFTVEEQKILKEKLSDK
jgi:hypothetical protein